MGEVFKKNEILLGHSKKTLTNDMRIEILSLHTRNLS